MKIETKPDPGGNPELAALQISSEKRDSLGRTLQRLEKEVTRTLSVNPEERTYRKGEGEDWGKDVTRARLWEFGDALNELKRIKAQLPQTYQTYLSRILGSTDDIREVFTDYRRNHPDKREPGGLAAYQPRDVVSVHQQLRELDPDRFPLDPINISDEQFERMGSDGSRSIDAHIAPRARLAEYDPERFRRVFGPKYSPQTIEPHLRFWEVQGARYLKDWQTIERVLTEHRTG